MLTREKVISEAIDRCMAEMYEKAQPSANWYTYLEKAKNGEIGKDERIYERHYLNHTQFEYILNKYKKAYRCVNEWRSNIDFLVKCFKEGGLKDIWVKDDSDFKGGYRSAEATPTLEKLIGKENADKVYTLIDDLKNFYHFDRDEEKLSFNVCLGASPCSNAKTVKEYWKSQGVDIEIDETELSKDDYWEIDHYGKILDEDDEEDEDDFVEESD